MTELPKVYQLPPLTEDEFRWLRLSHGVATAKVYGNLGAMMMFTAQQVTFIEKYGTGLDKFIHDLNVKMAQLLPNAMVMDNQGNITYQHDKTRSDRKG